MPRKSSSPRHSRATEPKELRRAWVYLNEIDQRRLAQMGRHFHKINEVTILSELISAALQAVEEAEFRVAMPVAFELRTTLSGDTAPLEEAIERIRRAEREVT